MTQVTFTPPPASAMESIKDTGAEKLLTSCLSVLARVYPEGLTARELVDELVKEDESFELTSSLLSSKLNTVFRRLHNERGAPTPQQLLDLPMTRKMTEDKRKRLIYHYVPNNVEAESSEPVSETTIEATSEGDEAKPTEDSASIVSAEPEAKQEEEEDQAKEESKEETVKKPSAEEAATTSTTTSDTPSPLETPRSRLSSVEEPATPQTPTSPKRKLEDKPESRKKHSRSSFNPYYDALTMDAPLPQLATAPQSPANWGEEMSEFEAPELIDLDALDACF